MTHIARVGLTILATHAVASTYRMSIQKDFAFFELWHLVTAQAPAISGESLIDLQVFVCQEWINVIRDRPLSARQIRTRLEELAEHIVNKKAQLSLTNPRDACEKFAQFT